MHAQMRLDSSQLMLIGGWHPHHETVQKALAMLHFRDARIAPNVDLASGRQLVGHQAPSVRIALRAIR